MSFEEQDKENNVNTSNEAVNSNEQVNNKENTGEKVEKNNGINENNQQKIKKNTPLRIISKIISIVAWLAIFVVLLLLICTALSEKTDIFGHRMYLIMSGSMEPTIGIKDAVVTEKKDEYHLGDVIAYEEDNVTVVHRIIEEQNEGSNKYFRTKGDANNAEDMEIVVNSQIKGIVKYRWPAVGRMILFVQSHLIVFILAIFILLVISIVRRLI